MMVMRLKGKSVSINFSLNLLTLHNLKQKEMLVKGHTKEF
jgi:hypothetical protein